jgi:hypothetical protein
VKAEWFLAHGGSIVQMTAAALNGQQFDMPDNPVYFDFSAPAGKSWKNSIGKIEVLGRDLRVKTPAGDFERCIRFSETSQSGNRMVWTFAPGVGFVQFGEGSKPWLLTSLAGSTPEGDAAPRDEPTPTPSSSGGDEPQPAKGRPSFALSANPFASEKFTPEAVSARVAQSKEAGVDAMYISVQWPDIGKPGNKYDVNDLKGNLANARKHNFKDVLFTLRIVDTNNKSVPEDLKKTKFDDPKMWDRLASTIDVLIPELKGTVTRINIGNEIDSYFGSHRNEVGAYLKLFVKAREKFKKELPGIPIAATVTHGGIVNSGTRKLLRPILDASDFLSVTYYPLKDDFTMNPPRVVPGDFQKMRDAAKDLAKHQIVIQEVGYPSGEGNDSSPEKQAEFFSRVIDEVRRDPGTVVFVNFFLMSDLPDWMVNDFAQYYKLPGVERFKSYLKTLGVFDDRGQPKPAWNVLKQKVGGKA